MCGFVSQIETNYLVQKMMRKCCETFKRNLLTQFLLSLLSFDLKKILFKNKNYCQFGIYGLDW